MEIQERINAYWSRRADEFGDARYVDMQGKKKEWWETLIRQHLPAGEGLRVLDLGTGGGFFAFILCGLGCRVTAIDYSEDMLRNARENAGKLGFEDIVFCQMDAQNLRFEDGAFDFIFTRNVTWTLPDPAKAYAEMVRVLAPGGKLMNADANYAQAFRQQDAAGVTEKHAQENYGGYAHPARSLAMLRERNDIASSLYIADESRPFWDLQLLSRLGMGRFWVDMDVNRHQFGIEVPQAASLMPEFVLTAEKTD